MNCLRPFTRREDGFGGFGCGQCMPCRIDRSRKWTSRINLESRLHNDSCFVTLTYAPEHLPPGGTLIKRDLQLFLKKLRKLYPPKSVRYFAVGEYGDESGRPHYHLCLFGVSVIDEDNVRRSWSHGHVKVDELNEKTAGYVSQYVCKKWTNKKDPYVQKLLNGRLEEFAIMSLRPGIGAGAAPIIAQSIENRDTDVPKTLRVDGKMRPLGRYIRRKIAGLIANVEDVTEYERKVWLQKAQEELCILQQEADKAGKSLKDFLGEQRIQRYYNLLSKHKAFRGRRKL